MLATSHLFVPKSIPCGTFSHSFSRAEEGLTLGTSENFDEGKGDLDNGNYKMATV